MRVLILKMCLHKKIIERKLTMDDPYPVRKELLEEFKKSSLQCLFYEKNSNARQIEIASTNVRNVANQILKERNDQVFDLFGHSRFFSTFLMFYLDKRANDFDKCLILYCLEHKSCFYVDLNFFPE